MYSASYARLLSAHQEDELHAEISSYSPVILIHEENGTDADVEAEELFAERSLSRDGRSFYPDGDMDVRIKSCEQLRAKRVAAALTALVVTLASVVLVGALFNTSHGPFEVSVQKSVSLVNGTCRLPSGWCEEEGSQVIYTDCDSDGQPDPFCQSIDSSQARQTCGCLQSSNDCNDTSPAKCPDTWLAVKPVHDSLIKDEGNKIDLKHGMGSNGHDSGNGKPAYAAADEKAGVVMVDSGNSNGAHSNEDIKTPTRSTTTAPISIGCAPPVPTTTTVGCAPPVPMHAAPPPLPMPMHAALPVTRPLVVMVAATTTTSSVPGSVCHIYKSYPSDYEAVQDFHTSLNPSEEETRDLDKKHLIGWGARSTAFIQICMVIAIIGMFCAGGRRYFHLILMLGCAVFSVAMPNRHYGWLTREFDCISSQVCILPTARAHPEWLERQQHLEYLECERYNESDDANYSSTLAGFVANLNFSNPSQAFQDVKEAMQNKAQTAFKDAKKTIYHNVQYFIPAKLTKTEHALEKDQEELSNLGKEAVQNKSEKVNVTNPRQDLKKDVEELLKVEKEADHSTNESGSDDADSDPSVDRFLAQLGNISNALEKDQEELLKSGKEAVGNKSKLENETIVNDEENKADVFRTQFKVQVVSWMDLWPSLLMVVFSWWLWFDNPFVDESTFDGDWKIINSSIEYSISGNELKRLKKSLPPEAEQADRVSFDEATIENADYKFIGIRTEFDAQEKCAADPKCIGYWEHTTGEVTGKFALLYKGSDIEKAGRTWKGGSLPNSFVKSVKIKVKADHPAVGAAVVVTESAALLQRECKNANLRASNSSLGKSSTVKEVNNAKRTVRLGTDDWLPVGALQGYESVVKAVNDDHDHLGFLMSFANWGLQKLHEKLPGGDKEGSPIAGDQPAKESQAKDPPANDPPANDPPANDPPATSPEDKANLATDHKELLTTCLEHKRCKCLKECVDWCQQKYEEKKTIFLIWFWNKYADINCKIHACLSNPRCKPFTDFYHTIMVQYGYGAKGTAVWVFEVVPPPDKSKVKVVDPDDNLHIFAGTPFDLKFATGSGAVLDKGKTSPTDDKMIWTSADGSQVTAKRKEKPRTKQLAHWYCLISLNGSQWLIEAGILAQWLYNVALLIATGWEPYYDVVRSGCDGGFHIVRPDSSLSFNWFVQQQSGKKCQTYTSLTEIERDVPHLYGCTPILLFVVGTLIFSLGQLMKISKKRSDFLYENYCGMVAQPNFKYLEDFQREHFNGPLKKCRDKVVGMYSACLGYFHSKWSACLEYFHSKYLACLKYFHSKCPCWKDTFGSDENEGVQGAGENEGGAGENEGGAEKKEQGPGENGGGAGENEGGAGEKKAGENEAEPEDPLLVDVGLSALATLCQSVGTQIWVNVFFHEYAGPEDRVPGCLLEYEPRIMHNVIFYNIFGEQNPGEIFLIYATNFVYTIVAVVVLLFLFAFVINPSDTKKFSKSRKGFWINVGILLLVLLLMLFFFFTQLTGAPVSHCSAQPATRRLTSKTSAGCIKLSGWNLYNPFSDLPHLKQLGQHLLVAFVGLFDVAKGKFRGASSAMMAATVNKVTGGEEGVDAKVAEDEAEELEEEEEEWEEDKLNDDRSNVRWPSFYLGRISCVCLKFFIDHQCFIFATFLGYMTGVFLGKILFGSLCAGAWLITAVAVLLAIIFLLFIYLRPPVGRLTSYKPDPTIESRPDYNPIDEVTPASTPIYFDNKPYYFTHRPVGIEFSKTAPIKVDGFIFNSQAEHLQVKRGMTLTKYDDTDVKKGETISDIEDKLNNSLPLQHFPLKFEFKDPMTGEIKPFSFHKKPIGFDFFVNRFPITVSTVKENSLAKEEKIQSGWELVTLAGMDTTVEGMNKKGINSNSEMYKYVYDRLLEGLRELPAFKFRIDFMDEKGQARTEDVEDTKTLGIKVSYSSRTIEEIHPGSPAAKMGIQRGWSVSRINEHYFAPDDDFHEGIQAFEEYKTKAERGSVVVPEGGVSLLMTDES